jgi:hypothetical protein
VPLKLPIAVVAIDNAAHELMRLAIQDTLSEIEPEQVIICTDSPPKIAVSGAEYFHFGGGYNEVMETLWYDVPLLVRTNWFLWIQWDSQVINADAWSDEYLAYDYIGAPWPCHFPSPNPWADLGYVRGRNVGNGGFSGRSRRLMSFLREHRDQIPWAPGGEPEDDRICRLYRPVLEEAGFTWAPEELAERFSFEFGDPVRMGVFGFHNCLNWTWALSYEQREERIRAANSSPFVLRSGAFDMLKDWHSTQSRYAGVNR